MNAVGNGVRAEGIEETLIDRNAVSIIKDLAVCAREDESGSVAAVRDGVPKTAHHRESAAFRRVALQLGHRVRELRQGHGWTVEEAAERFGIEPAHVRRVEAGRTNPSLATLVSIAHGLATDLASLLTKTK
ncbi:MAG: helix-turn-helix transcriptional regulator [Polyangiaceae bacterium]|jgi:DNA-binding XRE family transcriptional regulator